MVTHMSRLRRILSAMPVVLALALFAAPLAAGPGHDHDNDGGSALAVAANPRGAVQTGSFQAVAIQFGSRLLVYLDDPDANTPISGAEIELTPPGAAAVTLADRGDGVYVAEGLKLLAGHNSLLLFVTTATAADLLNIDMDIPGDGAAPAAPLAATDPGRGTLPLLIAVPAAIAIGVLISSHVTRVTRRRQQEEEEEAGVPAGFSPAGVVMAGADPVSLAQGARQDDAAPRSDTPGTTSERDDATQLAGAPVSRPVA